ncbi:unnamed protein product [Parnassius apollo]|uniref:(apollo) hypothetical protein n=1 Tax=Parnassius apollo TaxID=110799 RepID=A0A8S3WS46_PARAO|nr:unnamed protein product [Parnassius apollo]
MLEKFLEDHNELIRLIKRVSPRLQNYNYQVVIKADKVPLGEHAVRFNAPTLDEVAIIMEYWEKDGLVDDVLQQLVIDLGGEESSDSEIESE